MGLADALRRRDAVDDRHLDVHDDGRPAGARWPAATAVSPSPASPTTSKPASRSVSTTSIRMSASSSATTARRARLLAHRVGLIRCVGARRQVSAQWSGGSRRGRGVRGRGRRGRGRPQMRSSRRPAAGHGAAAWASSHRRSAVAWSAHRPATAFTGCPHGCCSLGRLPVDCETVATSLDFWPEPESRSCSRRALTPSRVGGRRPRGALEMRCPRGRAGSSPAPSAGSNPDPGHVVGWAARGFRRARTSDPRPPSTAALRMLGRGHAGLRERGTPWGGDQGHPGPAGRRLRSAARADRAGKARCTGCVSGAARRPSSTRPPTPSCSAGTSATDALSQAAALRGVSGLHVVDDQRYVPASSRRIGDLMRRRASRDLAHIRGQGARGRDRGRSRIGSTGRACSPSTAPAESTSGRSGSIPGSKPSSKPTRPPCCVGSSTPTAAAPTTGPPPGWRASPSATTTHAGSSSTAATTSSASSPPPWTSSACAGPGRASTRSRSLGPTTSGCSTSSSGRRADARRRRARATTAHVLR